MNNVGKQKQYMCFFMFLLEIRHVLAGSSPRRPRDLSYIERVRKFKMNVLVIY